MYGRIYPISELPEGAVISARDYQHFFTIMLNGTTYYIPIRKGSKTALDKMFPNTSGVSKLEQLAQDIIFSVKNQVRDDVASEVHTSLRQQINDSFEKMYGENLFKTITDKMDSKIAIAEHTPQALDLNLESILNLFGNELLKIGSVQALSSNVVATLSARYCKDYGENLTRLKPKKAPFVAPTWEKFHEYYLSIGETDENDIANVFDRYVSCGWKVGGDKPMIDWKAAVNLCYRRKKKKI